MKKINWTKWGTIIALAGLILTGYQLWHQQNEINQTQSDYINLKGDYNVLAQSSTIIQQAMNSSTVANIIKSKVAAPINSPHSPIITIGGNNSGPIANGNNVSAAQYNGPVTVNNSALSPYIDVATLNWDGKPFSVNYTGGLEYKSSISDALGAYVSVNSSSQIVPLCSPSSTAAFQKIISINPDFPWSYFYLGDCQQALGLPSSTWESTMQPAFNILKMTTQIPGHDPTQDNFYNYLKNIFGN